MKRINKVLLLIIGLFLFSGVVNASSYDLTVVKNGKKTVVRHEEMDRVSQELFNGEIVYSTSGITLNKTANRIDRIYLEQKEDANANITITVKGDNKINLLYIDGLRVTVNLYDDNSSFTFNAGRKELNNNYSVITNSSEQSAFFSNYIYFRYDHKFNSDGSIRLYKSAETTTTKVTQRATTVTKTAEVLKEDSNMVYNSDKSISIESRNGDDFEAETGLYGKEYELNEQQKQKVNDQLSKMDLPEIISVFDISIIGRGKELPMAGNYIIRIKMQDRLAYFEDFKVVYLDDDLDILEVIRAEEKDDNVQFNTTHLSKYGIIGTYKSATAVVKHVQKNSTIQSIFLIVALGLAIAVIIYSTAKKLKSSSKEAVTSDDEIVFEMFEEEQNNHSYVPEVEEVSSKKKDKGPTIGDEPLIAYAVALPEEAIAPGAVSQTTDIAKTAKEEKKDRKKKKKKEKEIIVDAPKVEVEVAPEVPEVQEVHTAPVVEEKKEEKKEEPKVETKKEEPKKEEKKKNKENKVKPPVSFEEEQSKKDKKEDKVQPPISFD